MEGAFGIDVDYAQLVKLYGEPPHPAGRFSPAERTGARKMTVQGKRVWTDISTSYVERRNLTMRMQMRRFTRLTNAVSKRGLPHYHMVLLYTVWYNFVRKHQTLRCSLATAAGPSETLWSMEDVIDVMDARADALEARGRYRTKARIAAET